jgi:hypothetical protein
MFVLLSTLIQYSYYALFHLKLIKRLILYHKYMLQGVVLQDREEVQLVQEFFSFLVYYMYLNFGNLLND